MRAVLVGDGCMQTGPNEPSADDKKRVARMAENGTNKQGPRRLPSSRSGSLLLMARAGAQVIVRGQPASPRYSDAVAPEFSAEPELPASLLQINTISSPSVELG